MPVGKVAEQFPDQQQQLQQQQQKQTSASAISSNSNSNTHTNTTVKAGHLDTANGIRTSDLYETGHFEANSDLCGSDAGEHIRNYDNFTDKLVAMRIFSVLTLVSASSSPYSSFRRFINFNNIGANTS